jgi:hypothetical protein
MFIFFFFFGIKGIVYKDFILAGQTVNSASYCDFYSDEVKMYEHFAMNFDHKRTGCCTTTGHHLTLTFSSGNFFTKNNITVILTHPTFLFPQLMIGLKCRHFDTTEVIEAESQEVLNTLTEHDFQDAFKK